MAARDNARTKLAQVRNFLTLFREWITSCMPALLKIFDSIVGQGNGTPPANSLLSSTCFVTLVELISNVVSK